jgi:NADH-quinone oxidoreductase subunit C
MTIVLSGQDVAGKISAKFPEAVVESNSLATVIKIEYLLKVADFFKNSPELAFNQLNDITSVDYFDYFEIVYRMTSIEHNYSLVLKVRCFDRATPEVPSLIGLWRGADLMEREVFDLMGIRFTGHPNMKRIFLWEGFNGHPLRKDFL